MTVESEAFAASQAKIEAAVNAAIADIKSLTGELAAAQANGDAAALAAAAVSLGALADNLNAAVNPPPAAPAPAAPTA